jgi:hypothetical protein
MVTTPAGKDVVRAACPVNSCVAVSKETPVIAATPTGLPLIRNWMEPVGATPWVKPVEKEAVKVTAVPAKTEVGTLASVVSVAAGVMVMGTVAELLAL